MHKKRVVWTIVLFLLFLASLLLDKEVVIFFSYFRGEILNEIFFGLTHVSSGIIIFFILTSLFLWKDHKRKLILPLWLTFLFSVITSFLLKVIVHRPRPYQIGIVEAFPLLEKAAHNVWDFSFPSFQAMLAFSALPIISKEFPKLKYVWFGFAFLVAISRVYFGIHFLSDVIVGGAVGYLIGVLILKFEEKTNLGEKIYRKIFNKK